MKNRFGLGLNKDSDRENGSLFGLCFGGSLVAEEWLVFNLELNLLKKPDFLLVNNDLVDLVLSVTGIAFETLSSSLSSLCLELKGDNFGFLKLEILD